MTLSISSRLIWVCSVTIIEPISVFVRIVDSFSSEAEAFENGAKAENRKALAIAGTIIHLTPISLTLIIFILVKLLLTMGLG
ncbi:hypothetical protein [Peribacillus frigoritolerans]